MKLSELCAVCKWGIWDAGWLSDTDLPSNLQLKHLYELYIDFM